MHVSKKSSAPRRFIQILDNDHPRRRHRENARPPIAAVAVTTALDRGGSTAQTGGCRITNHRRQILEYAADAGVRKSRVGEPDVKGLNRVANRTRVQAPKCIQLGLRNKWSHGQANPLALRVCCSPPAKADSVPRRQCRHQPRNAPQHRVFHADLHELIHLILQPPRRPTKMRATARNQDNNQRIGQRKNEISRPGAGGGSDRVRLGTNGAAPVSSRAPNER